MLDFCWCGLPSIQHEPSFVADSSGQCELIGRPDGSWPLRHEATEGSKPSIYCQVTAQEWRPCIQLNLDPTTSVSLNHIANFLCQRLSTHSKNPEHVDYWQGIWKSLRVRVLNKFTHLNHRVSPRPAYLLSTGPSPSLALISKLESPEVQVLHQEWFITYVQVLHQNWL